MLNGPLVSVVVVTYNSGKYVLETLESIKNQSYQHLELIISDDCSLDNTVELCQSWLEKHGMHFLRTKIITSPCNNGISANSNKGYKEAHGTWIKGIAGDDVLLPNCIADNVSYVENHPDATVVFSKMQGFKGEELCGRVLPTVSECAVFEYPTEKQLIYLIQNNFATAPTAFINRKTFFDSGCFDERFPFLDDYPFWVKLAEKGFHLDLLDKLTVHYRLEESITRKKDCFVSLLFYKSYKSFLLKKILPLCRERRMYYSLYLKYLYIAKMEFAIHVLRNKITPFNYFLMRLFSLLNFTFLWKNK